MMTTLTWAVDSLSSAQQSARRASPCSPAPSSTLAVITSPTGRVNSTVMSMSVCLSVHLHNWRTRRPIIIELSVHVVTCDHGLVLLCCYVWRSSSAVTCDHGLMVLLCCYVVWPWLGGPPLLLRGCDHGLVVLLCCYVVWPWLGGPPLLLRGVTMAWWSSSAVTWCDHGLVVFLCCYVVWPWLDGPPLLLRGVTMAWWSSSVVTWCDHGLMVLLWQHCDTLSTSRSADDIFSQHGAN